MPLSREQTDPYHQRGYLTVEGLLGPDEVRAACAAISRVIAGNLVPLDIEKERREAFDKLPAQEREQAVRKIMGFTRVDDCLKALSEHPALLAALEQLVGEPVQLIQDMALLKPPHIGVEKPWHQDNAYFLYDPPEKVIGAWIALDPATAANGCMHVVPGTHLAGPVPHYHLRDCQIPDDRIAMDRVVPVPLPPGGAMLFSAYLHHGTPPNKSPHRRRALQFHYAAKSCRRITPQEQGRHFHEGQKYAGCAVYPKEESEKIVIEPRV